MKPSLRNLVLSRSPRRSLPALPASAHSQTRPLSNGKKEAAATAATAATTTTATPTETATATTAGTTPANANANANADVAHRGKSVWSNRDFYLSVLSSTSSKREARSYLQRFTPTAVRLPYLGGPAKTTPKHPREPALSDSESLVKPSEAYVSRLLENHANPATARFLQPADNAEPNPGLLDPSIAGEELHVSLVKIRDIDSICGATLHGVGRTLGQLQRLGLFAIVVLDDPNGGDQWRTDARMRTERIAAAIEACGGKARRVDGAFATSSPPPPQCGSSLVLSSPQLLLSPLSRGIIPILAPLAFDSSQRIVHVEANDVVRTLAECLSANSPASPALPASPASPAAAAQPPASRPVHLDRLIFLDPLGGIPALDRPSGAHVFVNLQQEFADIEASLRADGCGHHLKSLRTMRSALALLPPTASGVITTPEAAAAAHARLPDAAPQHPRIKNPLIHNLLTDKPIFSSSLPTATSPSTQTTLIKHGTPLQMFPQGTKLTSPEVDLAKLVALIEDSFGKTLDVSHYTERVNDRIAGLIIAGDYEGAAIVTWETPPADPSAPRVCYLDKFAVARRSQGVGGVADVVFKAMTASMQPGRLFDGAEGIVWRSRRNNPVNKWYFERAKGTWKFPGAGDMWTMFWTTEDVEVSQKRLRDYADVCRGIQPSLRDPVRR